MQHGGPLPLVRPWVPVSSAWTPPHASQAPFSLARWPPHSLIFPATWTQTPQSGPSPARTPPHPIPGFPTQKLSTSCLGLDTPCWGTIPGPVQALTVQSLLPLVSAQRRFLYIETLTHLTHTKWKLNLLSRWLLVNAQKVLSNSAGWWTSEQLSCGNSGSWEKTQFCGAAF